MPGGDDRVPEGVHRHQGFAQDTGSLVGLERGSEIAFSGIRLCSGSQKDRVGRVIVRLNQNCLALAQLEPGLIGGKDVIGQDAKGRLGDGCQIGRIKSSSRQPQ